MEFSETCQCSVCCVKVIHWHVSILDRSSPLETGQRRVVKRLVCSEAQRCLVVQRLLWLQPERPLLPHRLLHSDAAGRCAVGAMEGRVVLDEIQWNENQTVLICELNDNFASRELLLKLSSSSSSSSSFICSNRINTQETVEWYLRGNRGIVLCSSPSNVSIRLQYFMHCFITA